MLYLISLLSFLLPFQLSLHFNNFQSTVYGFRIDYLIPTLYITDIVALLIIFFGIGGVIARSLRRGNLKANYFTYVRNDTHVIKYLIFALLYLSFAYINIHNSSFIIPAIYKWLKVTEMVLLGLVIYNSKKFDIFKNFVKPLSYSVFIVSLLGIWQFLVKGSVGGFFYWLGERSFSFSDPNIAPYPYATFSHPNSFAGFLLVFGIFLLQYRNKFNAKYFWSSLFLVATNLILTNSLNIYLTIFLLLLLKFKNNISMLMFIDFTQRTFTYRIELIKASWQMIKNHFWFGVGLNNFIPNLVKVSNTFVNAWELQPVHNIFLLIFSETGIFGFVAFCFLVFSSLSPITYSLFAILATGLSDHYWLTLQQNMLLFVYVMVISKKKI